MIYFLSDIKLENIRFVKFGKDLELRVVGFSLMKEIRPGEKLHDIVSSVLNQIIN